MKSPALKQIFGQPSFPLRSKDVQAFVTERGGHLGPVTFKLGRRSVQPFSVAPWCQEKIPSGVPDILRVLRGDFFCMPFGANELPFHHERYPTHGETANGKWSFLGYTQNKEESTLRLSMRTKIRAAHVEKRVTLRPGQTVIYQEHIISGMKGPMNLGHHATLRFPDYVGAGRLSTSALAHQQVYVETTERPENRGYSILKPGAVFRDLRSVPTSTGDFADLSRYPARRGFEDIVILVADPKQRMAWSAVAFPEEGYVWFSLRDPRILTSTLLWISNGGRHYPPWNGRHVNVMGVEDITGFFHSGLAKSVSSNSLSKRGLKTHLVFDPKTPVSVKYIMGVAAIPKSFDRVKKIKIESGHVTLESYTGIKVRSLVNTDFIRNRSSQS